MDRRIAERLSVTVTSITLPVGFASKREYLENLGTVSATATQPNSKLPLRFGVETVDINQSESFDSPAESALKSVVAVFIFPSSDEDRAAFPNEESSDKR
jgi:hypothetical protein